MPSSSSFLTSEASEKRGGGSVKCCSGLTSATFMPSPLFTFGRRANRLRRRPRRPCLLDRERGSRRRSAPNRSRASRCAAVGGFDVDRRAFEFRGFHLACDHAFPDEVVEASHMSGSMIAQRFRRAIDVRRGGSLRALLGRCGSSICRRAGCRADGAWTEARCR